VSDLPAPLWLTLDDIEEIIDVLKEENPRHPIRYGLSGKDKILSALDRPLNTWMYRAK